MEDAIGLVNFGATCYLNTALQCLLHTNGFRDYMIKGGFRKYIDTPDIFAVAFQKFFTQLWTTKDCSAIRPTNFILLLEKYIKQKKNLNQQQDTHEFLAIILEILHDKTKYEVIFKKDHEFVYPIYPDLCRLADQAYIRHISHEKQSIIQKMFYGRCHTKIQCGCGHISHTFDPLCYLSLPIDKFTTLMACINDYTKEEIIDDYACVKCKKGKAKKTMKFWDLPKYLIVQLKRFKYIGNVALKINQKIDYPVDDLDLSKYLTLNEQQLVCSCKYQLYAVANHVGSPSSGHYYAYCRSKKGNFVELNDTTCRPISKTQMVTDTAYLLFYEKI